MRKLISLSLAVGLVLAVSVVFAADEEAKYTTKQVMKMAHKDGLLKKVAAGDGSEEESKKLLELYEALAKNKPKKGDEAAWKERTAAIVAAAKGVVEGKDGSGEALTKAANCGMCHGAHK
jgi:hypothetical protein